MRSLAGREQPASFRTRKLSPRCWAVRASPGAPTADAPTSDRQAVPTRRSRPPGGPVARLDPAALRAEDAPLDLLERVAGLAVLRFASSGRGKALVSFARTRRRRRRHAGRASRDAEALEAVTAGPARAQHGALLPDLTFGGVIGQLPTRSRPCRSRRCRPVAGELSDRAEPRIRRHRAFACAWWWRAGQPRMAKVAYESRTTAPAAHDAPCAHPPGGRAGSAASCSGWCRAQHEVDAVDADDPDPKERGEDEVRGGRRDC